MSQSETSSPRAVARGLLFVFWGLVLVLCEGVLLAPLFGSEVPANPALGYVAMFVLAAMFSVGLLFLALGCRFARRGMDDATATRWPGIAAAVFGVAWVAHLVGFVRGFQPIEVGSWRGWLAPVPLYHVGLFVLCFALLNMADQLGLSRVPSTSGQSSRRCGCSCFCWASRRT